jgi:Protein of unknown function (DUF1353)
VKYWIWILASVVFVTALLYVRGVSTPSKPPGPENSQESKIREPGPNGHFVGNIVTSWNTDGRTMTLLEDFAYFDATGKQWSAPKGSIVDGASIPGALWSYVGGPYTSTYRIASVVHDVACVSKKEKWEDVHRMFYEACRCAGLDDKRAKLMYWAVYQGGPRWELFKSKSSGDDTMVAAAEQPAREAASRQMESAAPKMRAAVPKSFKFRMAAPKAMPVQVNQQSLEEMQRLIDANGITLEDLERTQIPSSP